MEVNWGDDIPNIWENKIHVPVTTNQYIFFEGNLKENRGNIWEHRVECFPRTVRVILAAAGNSLFFPTAVRTISPNQRHQKTTGKNAKARRSRLLIDPKLLDTVAGLLGEKCCQLDWFRGEIHIWILEG